MDKVKYRVKSPCQRHKKVKILKPAEINPAPSCGVLNPAGRCGIKGKRKWFVNKAYSFKEAENWEDRYYASLTPQERLSDIQICRDNYYKFKGINARRKRFCRVFRIIKQVWR